jgi:hypothetical protein
MKGMGGKQGKVKKGGENGRKGPKNSWGRDRKVGQKRAKPVDI